MVMTISSRREAVNTIVLLIVVAAALNLDKLIPNFENTPVVQGIALLTSKGFYEIFVKIIFWIIGSSNLTLKAYWGKQYIQGLWSYEYSIENKMYFGVWDITQDVDGTFLKGNGLDDNFQTRTIVRSVSPLLEETGGFYFINSRNELHNQNAQVFSKTTLLLDRPKRLLDGVSSMRGVTVVYGGPSDKQVHPNVAFRRHDDVSNLEQLIEKLKKERAGPP